MELDVAPLVEIAAGVYTDGEEVFELNFTPDELALQDLVAEFGLAAVVEAFPEEFETLDEFVARQ